MYELEYINFIIKFTYTGIYKFFSYVIPILSDLFNVDSDVQKKLNLTYGLTGIVHL